MNGKVISGPTAVFLTALFFLPWILVSCEGAAIGEFSGYQLATGTPPEEMDMFMSADDMQAEPILFVVPLAGVVTLALLAVTLWKADFEQNAVWGRLIVSFTALLILVLEWLQWSQQNDAQMTTITAQPALWGSFVCLLLLGATAVLDVVGGQSQQPHHQNKPSPVLPNPPPAQFLNDTLIPSTDSFLYPDHQGIETIVDGDIMKTEVLSFDADIVTAWLILDNGRRQIELQTAVSIGRAVDNDIAINDTSLSSHHARIQIENGRFYIHDLNSTNGIYIMQTGQTRWQKETQYELQDGDEIKIGRAIVRFTTSAPTP